MIKIENNPVITHRITKKFCSVFNITNFAKLPITILTKINRVAFVINTIDEPKDMKFVAANDEYTEDIFSDLIQESIMTKVEEE